MGNAKSIIEFLVVSGFYPAGDVCFSFLVFEGFEKSIEKEMASGKSMEETAELFRVFIRTLARYEKESDSTVVLVMLEMGRGIVPLEKKDRELRDAAGWILQEAAMNADEVLYVWHGLARRIK